MKKTKNPITLYCGNWKNNSLLFWITNYKALIRSYWITNSNNSKVGFWIIMITIFIFWCFTGKGIFCFFIFRLSSFFRFCKNQFNQWMINSSLYYNGNFIIEHDIFVKRIIDSLKIQFQHLKSRFHTKNKVLLCNHKIKL